MSKYIDDIVCQLKPYNNYISDINKAVARPLIQLAGRSLDSNFVNEDPLALIQNRTGVSENLPEYYTIVYILMQSFFWAPAGAIKSNDLQQALKELNFQNEVIEDFINTLYGQHAQQLSLGFDHALSITSRPKHIAWKIDLSLIDSLKSNLTKPHVILKISLSDGQTKTFEVSAKMLHKLRLNVALILRNMIALENRTILKHL